MFGRASDANRMLLPSAGRLKAETANTLRSAFRFVFFHFLRALDFKRAIVDEGFFPERPKE